MNDRRVTDTEETPFETTVPIPPPTRPHYTLTSFNNQQHELYVRLLAMHRAHPNNIECPTCEAELWDVPPMVAQQINPAAIDPRDPPQQSVECQACGWRGKRLA